jgi:hypothetical protein
MDWEEGGGSRRGGGRRQLQDESTPGAAYTTHVSDLLEKCASLCSLLATQCRARLYLFPGTYERCTSCV